MSYVCRYIGRECWEVGHRDAQGDFRSLSNNDNERLDRAAAFALVSYLNGGLEPGLAKAWAASLRPVMFTITAAQAATALATPLAPEDAKP